MRQTDHSWTLESYIAHNESLRDAERKLSEERDRRYIEVDAEHQKAMRIKEVADEKAMDLARQDQVYKNEQANRLREQISEERGRYATKEDLQALADKFELMNKPVVEFMASQTGRTNGMTGSWAMITGLVTLLGGLIILGTFVFGSRQATPAPAPAQFIYAPTPVPQSTLPK